MSLGEEHEILVDDVREVLDRFLRPQYLKPDGPAGFCLAMDAGSGWGLCGVPPEQRRGLPRPDMWIIPQEAAGPIVVEVGEVKARKWQPFTAPDGAPIRVIRILWDRSVGILNPRYTDFEIDLIRCLQCHLKDLGCSPATYPSPRVA